MGTYTTNYNLFMPTVGETGWGTLVNGNFSTIDTTMKSLSNRITTCESYGARITAVENEVNGALSCTSVTTSGTITANGKITGNGGISGKLLVNINTTGGILVWSLPVLGLTNRNLSNTNTWIELTRFTTTNPSFCTIQNTVSFNCTASVRVGSGNVTGAGCRLRDLTTGTTLLSVSGNIGSSTSWQIDNSATITITQGHTYVIEGNRGNVNSSTHVSTGFTGLGNVYI